MPFGYSSSSAVNASGGRHPNCSSKIFDVPFLGQFLQHLELDRGNCTRTRNNRLAAIHAFFQYVAISEPACALQCQRVLAIPSKRYERGPVEFLQRKRPAALVAAPNPGTWIGRRDKALLLVAVQTGLRNSEITSLRQQDVEFGTGAHVPLSSEKDERCDARRYARTLPRSSREWLSQQGGAATDPVFPSSNGGRLSADAFQRLVSRHITTARRTCPSLKPKKVTPHTLRHAAAMALLHRGVDLSVIALWLGHESTETTQIYLHADMQLKERALAHATSSGLAPDRFRPPDPLLAFLERL
jgi:site-specific recombinase XerD